VWPKPPIAAVRFGDSCTIVGGVVVWRCIVEVIVRRLVFVCGRASTLRFGLRSRALAVSLRRVVVSELVAKS
jgi:hypothetical protein